MKILIRAYEEKDLIEMIQIWNEIVEEGKAFPQEDEPLPVKTAAPSHISGCPPRGSYPPSASGSY